MVPMRNVSVERDDYSRSVVDQPTSFATTAYRRDRRDEAQPFGDNDNAWLAVATMLEQAALFPGRDRPAKLRAVLRFARSAVDRNVMRRLQFREWQRVGLAKTDPVVGIADEAHDAGAFHLAAHILDSVLVVADALTTLQRGRIIDRRARAVAKLGHTNASADQYRLLLRLGTTSRVPELRARAFLGQAALAQMRGNYPEVVRLATKASILADRYRLAVVSRHAHGGLMIAAAVGGRFDQALAEGWLVYRASRGEPREEAEILQNLAQALFDAGHAHEAGAGFAAVACRDLPARFILPALGGLARAAAVLGDASTVRWSSREIDRLARSSAPKYSLASALLESAQALAAAGEPAAATRRARAAADLARAHGFHEIEYKADSLQFSDASREHPNPETLGPKAAAVARNVAQLAPKRLPDHLKAALIG